MRRIVLFFITLTAVAALSQQLPQFAYNNYDGWTYNNPGIPLNADNIGGSRISLYVNSEGLALMLTSPVFSCQGLDNLQATVKWKSRSQSIGLTMALDDADGVPIDSTVCYPASAGSQQTLQFSLDVPPGLASARLRFVSWDANVDNCGAVKSVSLTGESTDPPSTPGDIDGDGQVNIADVTALIDLLLSGNVGNNAADVDGDGQVSISDVTALIDILLSGK